jgi:phosphate acetyltransferase
VAARNVYIIGMAPESGKSVVAIGLMELLSARTERLGFFRPIVPKRTEPDPEIELMRRRYEVDATYDEMHAMDVADADALVAAGKQADLEKTVLAAYRSLAERFDFVVCEGTDFTGATPALDVELNAGIANHLGAPVVAVVHGGVASDAPGAVRMAREALERRRCEVAGVIVNRIAPEQIDEVAAAVAQCR